MTKLTTIIIVGAATMGLLLVLGTLVSGNNSDNLGCLSAEMENLCDEVKALGSLQFIVETDAETLLRLVDCHDPTVRRGAVYTLGERRVKAAVGALIKRLQDRDGHTRRIAARALGKIGAAGASQELIQVLEDRDETPAVRCEAAWALGMIRDSQADSSLTTVAAASRGRLREACLTARKNRDFPFVEEAD